MTTAQQIQTVQRNDVIRGQRYGNTTKANYVIDRVIEQTDRKITVEAHREHSGASGRFMIIDARTARVIRTYA